MFSLLARRSKKSKAATLSDVLADKNIRFPVVLSVQTYGSISQTREQTDNVTLLYVEKEESLKFVRGEVVELPTNESAEGSDISSRRSTLIGKEILIPVTYGGKLTPLHKDYNPHSYSSINELQFPLPHAITLQEDAELLTENESQTINVKSDTRLKVVTMERGDEAKLLIEHVSGARFKIKASQSVKFSAKLQLQETTLGEFIASKHLPKIVIFHGVSEGDILAPGQNDMEEIVTCLSGHVKLRETIEHRVIIGWVTQQPNSMFSDKVALIPKCQATNITVKEVYPFKTNKGMYDMFNECVFTEAIIDQMYTIHQDVNAISTVFISQKCKTQDTRIDDIAGKCGLGDLNHVLFPHEVADRLKLSDGYERLSEENEIVYQKKEQRQNPEDDYMNFPSKIHRPTMNQYGIQKKQANIPNRVMSDEMHGMHISKHHYTSKLDQRYTVTPGDGRRYAATSKPKGMNTKTKNTTGTEQATAMSASDVDSAHFNRQIFANNAYEVGSKSECYANEDQTNKDTACITDSLGTTRETFSQLSVHNLAKLLHDNGFQTLARICVDECLDGHFLTLIDDGMLKESPFNMKNKDIARLQSLFKH